MYTKDTLPVEQVVQQLTEDIASIASHTADAIEHCEQLMRFASESNDWDMHRDLQHILARIEGTTRQLGDTATTLHRVVQRSRHADVEAL